MLAVILAVLAVGWGVWLTYMIRYPDQWAQKVDAIHARLAPICLSFDWMKRFEKGVTVKVIVGATVVLMLTALVVASRHPDALSNFLRASHPSQ